MQLIRYSGAESTKFPMYYMWSAYCGGDAIGFEKLKDGQLVLYPENGLIAHSNHIRHPHYAYQVRCTGELYIVTEEF